MFAYVWISWLEFHFLCSIITTSTITSIRKLYVCLRKLGILGEYIEMCFSWVWVFWAMKLTIWDYRPGQRRFCWSAPVWHGFHLMVFFHVFSCLPNWCGSFHNDASSTRTRPGRAEVALDLLIRPFSSIELACTVRQPGPCVHAGFVRTCCTVVVQEHPRTWRARDHMPIQSEANTFFTLHTAPFTPRTSCLTLALHIPHFISSQIISDFFLPHVTSSQLFSSHPVPSHMSSD